MIYSSLVSQCDFRPWQKLWLSNPEYNLAMNDEIQLIFDLSLVSKLH